MFLRRITGWFKISFTNLMCNKIIKIANTFLTNRWGAAVLDSVSPSSSSQLGLPGFSSCLWLSIEHFCCDSMTSTWSYQINCLFADRLCNRMCNFPQYPLSVLLISFIFWTYRLPVSKISFKCSSCFSLLCFNGRSRDNPMWCFLL